jgi:PhoH-like ATPase
MHDPSSLLRFEEHDIYIPSVVLEELDNNKKGHTEVARNSRETSRFIEALIQHMEKRDKRWVLSDGLPLEHALGGTSGMGRLFIQTESEAAEVTSRLSELEKTKPDNHILYAARIMKEKHVSRYADVILVSKDINVRIKARSRSLCAEDYTNDMVETDADKNLYSGMTELSSRVWESKTQLRGPSAEGDTALYEITAPKPVILHTNQLLTGADATDAIVTQVDGSRIEIMHCRNYMKNTVHGIFARNPEQNFLLNLLMDPEIDFVTILGTAGTGKTLLTIAAALEQKAAGIYNGIIVTRVAIPVGEDIGFLPGGEEDKMGAWMGAIDDNLEVIAEALNQHDPRNAHPMKQLKNKFSSAGDPDNESMPYNTEVIARLKGQIKVKALTFMRGRTFQKKFFILDEAQNLTPKQMKTLVTRAGPGTKIICLGNLSQIDTPYLTETSSGLAYAIDRFKGWEHNGHVTLTRVERSRLAEHAVDVL